MGSPDIEEADLIDLLGVFSKKAFDASELGALDQLALSKCEMLLRLDYSVVELDNSNGVQSSRYPQRIFIPEYEHGHMAPTITASTANIPSHGNSTIGFDNCENGCDTSMEVKLGCSTTQTTRKDQQPTSYNTQHTSTGNGNAINSIEDSKNSIGTESLRSAASNGNNNNNSNSNNTQRLMGPATKIMREDFSYLRTNLPQQRTIYEDLYDINKIRELIGYAKYARCRQRFVVPVMMYRGKYICRSATLSVFHEAYGRYAFNYIQGNNSTERHIPSEFTDPTDVKPVQNTSDQGFSYDGGIKQDVQLLKVLNVKTIVDLMVENRKVKYFLTVSSSEKAHSAKDYDQFNILSLPYPGCEFFKNFRDNNYMARSLYYNWDLPINDADIKVPTTGPATEVDIEWEDFRSWDLVQITQNYLNIILKYLKEENSGLLVHCISGWDRTPLFISLLRLSLWADGLIHQSLNPSQITYLTLAYDWYLFGHQLPDRLKRGEEIMFFCFHVLKFLFDDQYSLAEPRKRTKTSSSGGSSVIILKQDEEAPFREDLFLTTCDQDSNDSISNISNCDMSITETFYAMTTPANSSNTLTNRSPNSKRSRTSPISVPGMSATRQRQESTSSNGSWQVVTDTGSIDSMANGSYMKQFGENRSENSSLQSGMSIPMNSGNISIGGGSNHSVGGTNGSFSSSSSNNSNISNGSKSGLSYPTTNNVAHTMTASDDGARAVSMGESSTEDASISSRSRIGPSLREQRLNAVRAIFIRAYGKAIGLKFKEGSSMNIATLVGTLF